MPRSQNERLAGSTEASQAASLSSRLSRVQYRCCTKQLRHWELLLSVSNDPMANTCEALRAALDNHQLLLLPGEDPGPYIPR